ncbi:unnamed protein product [Lactuca saligna]|uniref:Uncharacterized protein n=1 Tax=Lactuca saligna TaxID=75948 RepID=A0AA35ZL65_LACSI|nr:unnamed protein product [Lactuca saligna]
MYSALHYFLFLVWLSTSVVLDKGVVRVIDKVIKSAKFASRVLVVREACEALGIEKGKQLGGCSTSFGEHEVSDPVRVTRRAKEVDATLLSLAEMNFVGFFHLGRWIMTVPPVLSQFESGRFFALRFLLHTMDDSSVAQCVFPSVGEML